MLTLCRLEVRVDRRRLDLALLPLLVLLAAAKSLALSLSLSTIAAHAPRSMRPCTQCQS